MSANLKVSQASCLCKIFQTLVCNDSKGPSNIFLKNKSFVVVGVLVQQVLPDGGAKNWLLVNLLFFFFWGNGPLLRGMDRSASRATSGPASCVEMWKAALGHCRNFTTPPAERFVNCFLNVVSGSKVFKEGPPKVCKSSTRVRERQFFLKGFARLPWGGAEEYLDRFFVFSQAFRKGQPQLPSRAALCQPLGPPQGGDGPHHRLAGDRACNFFQASGIIYLVHLFFIAKAKTSHNGELSTGLHLRWPGVGALQARATRHGVARVRGEGCVLARFVAPCSAAPSLSGPRRPRRCPWC